MLHILVKDEETAKKVKEELGQGKSFEELAKQYSEDTGSKEKRWRLRILRTWQNG